MCAGSFGLETSGQSSNFNRLFSPCENDSLLEMRDKAKKIDRDLNAFTRLTKDIYHRILEAEAKGIYRHGSSVLEGYTKNDSLFKIVVTYEGDRDTYISQYYFSKSKIFYVLKSLKHYAPPKWDAKSKIVKEDIIEYFLTEKGLAVNNTGMKVTRDKLQLEAEALAYETLLKQ